MLAETLTAVTEQSPQLSYSEIVSFVLAAIALFQQVKIWRWRDVFRATAKSVQVLLDNMPKPDDVKKAKTTMKFAVPEELREDVDKEVKKALAREENK